MRVLIDNIDIYATYGAMISKGGLNGVLALPPSKKVSSNDWAEDDGIEPDLSEIYLDKRSLSIPFVFLASYDKIEAFLAFLESTAYHSINFDKISLTKRFRYISSTSLKYAKEISSLVCNFSEDSFEVVDITPVQVPITGSDSVELDGIALTDYGIRLLKGSLPSAVAPYDTKQRLSSSSQYDNGVDYDGAEGLRLKRKSREFTLHCLLVAPSFETAWRNYMSFFHKLVSKNPSNGPTKECLRTLVFNSPIEKTIRCYYKNQSVTSFFTEKDRIWLEFTLTLTEVL